jgi:hypothetical protein
MTGESCASLPFEGLNRLFPLNPSMPLAMPSAPAH